MMYRAGPGRAPSVRRLAGTAVDGLEHRCTKHRLEHSAEDEGGHARGDGFLHADHRGQPGAAEQQAQGVADQHRREGQHDAPAMPAALDQPAGQRAGHGKGQQVAARRSQEARQASRAAGEHRQAERALGQPDEDRQATQAPAVQCADQRDGQRLHGHRHRHHGHADVGRRGEHQGAEQHRQHLGSGGLSAQPAGCVEGPEGLGRGWGHGFSFINGGTGRRAHPCADTGNVIDPACPAGRSGSAGRAPPGPVPAR